MELDVVCLHWANAPEAIRRLFGLVRVDTTTDAINREPLRMATGAPAVPTPTDHSTAYPGGGASLSQFFKQHDRPNSTRTEG